MIRRRHIAGLALAALLAQGSPESARARPETPTVTVDGQEAHFDVRVPHKRDDEWFLPAAPIARILGLALAFDTEGRIVSVTDPHDGTTQRYLSVSGELERENQPTLAFPPGLAAGAGVDDLVLPMTVIGLLCNAQLHVSADEYEITLVSRRATLTPGVSNLGAFGMKEVRYNAYAYQNDHVTDGGLTVETLARAGRGSLQSRAFVQAAESETPVLRSFLASYAHRSGNTYSAGDLAVGSEIAWLNAGGRGARWDYAKGRGEQRLSFTYLKLADGATGGEGRLTRPHFDTDVVSSNWSWGARPGAPAGQAVSIGVVARGKTRDAERGMLVAAQHRYARRWLRVQNSLGHFATQGERVDERLATESRLELMPWRALQLNGRYAYHEREFRVPTTSFPERGSRIYSVGGRVSPLSFVSLHGSRTEIAKDDTDSLSGASVVNNGQLSLYVGAGLIETASAGYNEVVTDGYFDKTFLFDLRGAIFRGSWYVSARGRGNLDNARAYTGGLTQTTPFGMTTLGASWSQKGITSAALTIGRSLSRRMQFTAGMRWNDQDDPARKDYLFNVRVGYRFGETHRTDLVVHERQYTVDSRINMKGRFEFGEKDGPLAHTPTPSRPVRHIADIGGQVYLDQNMNGLMDGKDRPVPGVEILLNGGKKRAITDDYGRYLFKAIPAGEHEIRLALKTLRADLTLLEEGRRTVTAPAFESIDVAFRTGFNRSVTGLVFLDANRNGELDDEEEGMAEVHLVASNGSDTITWSDGRFRISDIAPGGHSIVIDRTSVPGYEVPATNVRVMIPMDGEPETVLIPVTKPERAVTRTIFTSR
ncbi:MAG: hypothetical protein HKN20_13540 [Gemmatimonadetes bacterium]|nr:hypothetical protein [Gemmatimonadota bacterium]